MTRSLGDYYAHRHGVSCEPEIVRYVVNQLPADARSAGEHLGSAPRLGTSARLLGVTA